MYTSDFWEATPSRFMTELVKKHDGAVEVESGILIAQISIFEVVCVGGCTCTRNALTCIYFIMLTHNFFSKNGSLRFSANKI